MSRPSRIVFVGNVAYSITEEMLVEIFSSVGPVVVRIVFDKETGKSKGFAFCEYRDVDTAHSAVRHLNGLVVMGRPLRVDFSESESKSGSKGSSRATRSPPLVDPPKRSFDTMNSAAPISNPNVYSNQSSPPSIESEIDSLLAKMSHDQLYEIIRPIKALIEEDPAQARQILTQNPQYAYALLRSQLILGLSPAVASQTYPVKSSVNSQGSNFSQPVYPAPAPQMHSVPAPSPTFASEHNVSYSNGVAHVPSFPQYNQPDLFPELSPEQKQMVQQLITLTPDQIAQLPYPTQQQVFAVLQRVRDSQVGHY
eukprot:TRINITY_DN7935_c0_g1_i1.p1 TRINITY_DN7935_c0_g1~~TRINITY_DN7935_c0_g1_i1.p1  ORF type:complete len:310 (-),score=51.18 TRINITY_DN7935_c0_g1_i1:10-939(-)